MTYGGTISRSARYKYNTVNTLTELHWLSDHPREVIEAALAHVVRNRVEAASARSDLFERRRRLMDDWARYLD